MALGRLISTAAFFLVIAAVPVIEWCSGVWPGVGVTRADGFGGQLGEVVRGEWSAEVERELADRSVVAEALRPTYSAAMFRLFRKVNPKLVLGDDDWLFLASTVRGYPPANARTVLPETAALIAALQQWLRTQGTELYVLVVPNKATMYANRLGSVRPRFKPYYREVHAELQRRGVWCDDFQAVLSAAPQPSYYAFDSHWTMRSAWVAAQQVAASVRERYAGQGLPGEGVAGRVEEGVVDEFIAPLTEMLGVGDRLGVRAGMRDRDQRLRGVHAMTGESLAVEQAAALVWVGTSFSDGFHTASLFSAELQRVVEDRSMHGRGPTAALLGVVNEIRNELRDAPKLVVWEFPERYFFTSAAQMQEPLRQKLRALNYNPRTAARMTWSRREWEGMEVTRDTRPSPETIDGAEPGEDPGEEFLEAEVHAASATILYRLDPRLPGDDSGAISLELTTSRFANLRAFLDFGEGFPSEPQAQSLIPRRGVAQQIWVPLVGGGKVHGLKLEISIKRGPRGEDSWLRLRAPEIWAR